MYEWGVAPGLKAICWCCPAYSTTTLLLSHKNTTLSHFLICRPILLYHSLSPSFLPSLLSLTVRHCRLLGKTGTQTGSEEQRLNRNTKFGLCLISSSKPAVTTPPAYKCTCRFLSLEYYTMSFCLISGCSAMSSSHLLCDQQSHPHQIRSYCTEILKLWLPATAGHYYNEVTMLQGVLSKSTKYVAAMFKNSLQKGIKSMLTRRHWFRY